MFALVPGQRMRPSLLDVGQRDVTAVANDVHDQSVRNLMFDLRDVQKMIWCAVSPALDSLMTGGLLHYNSQEVPGAVAFPHDLFADLPGLEATHLKKFAPQPILQKLAPVIRGTQVAKSRLQDAKA